MFKPNIKVQTRNFQKPFLKVCVHKKVRPGLWLGLVWVENSLQESIVSFAFA